jgi:hypothetical protein
MATMAVLAVAVAASAAPTISLTWTDTTGSGTTGGSSIDALAGDVVRLLITVNADANGLTFGGVSLGWDAGDLVGGNALECPAPENSIPGTCSDGGGFVPPFYSPFAPGVVVGAGSASSFDAGGTPPPITTSMFLGSIEFTVGATAAVEDVSIFYVPAIDSVNDGLGQVFFPNASASLVVPEPGTAALMGLGLGTLGFLGRRRS